MNLPPVHGYGVPTILSQWNKSQDRRERKQRFDDTMDFNQAGRDQTQENFTKNFEETQTANQDQREHNQTMRMSKVASDAMATFTKSASIFNDNPANAPLANFLATKAINDLTTAFPGLKKPLEELVKSSGNGNGLIFEKGKFDDTIVAGIQNLIMKGDEKSIREARISAGSLLSSKLIDQDKYDALIGMAKVEEEKNKANLANTWKVDAAKTLNDNKVEAAKQALIDKKELKGTPPGVPAGNTDARNLDALKSDYMQTMRQHWAASRQEGQYVNDDNAIRVAKEALEAAVIMAAKFKELGGDLKELGIDENQLGQEEQIEMPSPSGENKGRTIRDTGTGKRFKSDGEKWVEIK